MGTFAARFRTSLTITVLLALFATLLAVVAPPPASGQEGAPASPDLSYGDADGVASVFAPSGTNRMANVAGVVPQPDGGAIVVGTVLLFSELNYRDVVLARLTPSGALDTTWGTDGYVLADVGAHVAGGTAGSEDHAAAVTVDDAGTLFVAGSYGASDLTSGRPSLFLMAFGPDGTVAPVFDGAGAFAAPLATSDVAVGGVAVDAAGRLVVAGTVHDSGLREDILVARLAGGPTGYGLDGTFGEAGVVRTDVAAVQAEPTAGPEDLAHALAIDHAGRVLVVGASGSDTTWDQVVLRYDDSGALDTTFGVAGLVTIDYSEADFGRGILVDGTGGADAELSVVGDIEHHLATADPAVTVTRLSSTGAELGRIAGPAGVQYEAGFDASARAVVPSAFGIPVVVGASSALVEVGDGTTEYRSDFGVARFDPAGPDAAFAPGGVTTIPCGMESSGATTAVTQPDGMYLVAGMCGDAATIVRLLGDSGSLAPTDAVTDLALTVSPSAPAGRERTPLSGLDALQALSGSEGAIQAAPLRNTPLRNTPLRNTPLRNTPLRNTPLRNTPLRNTTLAPILLAEVPLRNTSWTAVLAGSPYDGVPLQTVTLDDVFALPDADTRLAHITLDMIDLANTPLRNTTLSGLLLGALTLAELPAPHDGWCAFLHDGGACPSDLDPTTTTLFEVELRGHDLSDYYATPLALGGLPLAGTVLGAVLVDDLRIADTPLGVVAAADVAEVLTCGSACTGTFAEAQQAGLVEPSATVAALVAAAPWGPLEDVSLGQLLVGMLPLESLPFEDLPLRTILDNAEIRSTDLLTYHATFSLDCAALSSLEGQLFVPPGTRLASAPPSRVRPSSLSVSVAQTSVAKGVAELAFGGSCTGTAVVSFQLQAEPPAVLGPTGSSRIELTTDGWETLDEATSGEYETVGRTTDDGSSLATSHLYTGHLDQPGDVDHYTIPAPLPGSRLTVSLSHLPADYDLVLYGPDPDDPETAPLRNTPLRNTPLRNTPLRNTPLRNTGLADGAEEPGTDGQSSAPDRLQDVPLRNTPLRNTSIHTGTETESVSTLVRGSDEGGAFTVQVSGFNGASSPQPYVLRVTTAERLAPLPCVARPYTGGTLGTLPDPTLDHGQVQTLLLVNQQRLQAAYATDAATTAAVLDRLAELAAHPSVNGLVLPVDGDSDVQTAYGAWDEDPCSLDAANGVVDAINRVVDRYVPAMPDLKHLVLVGGDELLPQARVPDLTTVGNQVEYTEDLRFDVMDNPLSSAARDAHVLTDDPYGDLDPQAWLDGQLYVPDVALGRLVESPTEILGAIDRFLDPTVDGVLDPSTSFVAGYDFLTDGATEVRDAVDPNGGSSHRIDETWSAADATGGVVADQFASVNAHYDHYQGLPADTHAENAADLFSAGQLAQDLSGSVLFTMGCNAGLNVADVFVSTPAAEDWAQAASARGALFTGNTGFGYGDTEFVAYSEALMAQYARNLAGGQMTVGQALMYAKQHHVAQLGVPGVYDAKAMEESTFYGLPMYRVGPAGTAAPAALPQPAPTATTDVDLQAQTHTVEPFGTTGPQATTSDRGTVWTVPDQAPQVSHFRPVQPKTTVDVTPTDGLAVHGALLEGLTSTDVLGVDPVYATPTIDLEANEPEADVTDTVFPTRLQSVTSHPTPQGWRDQLVLMAGQFATDTAAGDGTGTQRLFTSMQATVYRSDGADFTPPAITEVEGVVADGTAIFEVATPDTDVLRAVVLYLLPGEHVWQKVELGAGAPGTWTGIADVGTSTEVPQFLVQLLDRAGNVGSTINKSFGYRAAEVQVPPGHTAATITLSPAIPDSGYLTADPQVTVGDEAGAATFEYRVDGGPWTAYEGSFGLTGTGDAVHQVEVRGSDGSVGQVWVPVDRAGPTVTVLGPATGTTVPAGSPLATRVVCTDAVSGVATCPDGVVLPTDQPGAHSVTVDPATDRAGHATAVAPFTYEVLAPPYRFDGFYEPVQNDAENVVQSGRAIPIKFRLYDGETSVDAIEAITVRASQVTDACDSSQSTNTVTETVSSSTAGLSWDPVEEQFVYVHKSKKNVVGCQTLSFDVAHPDGSTTTHGVMLKYRR